MFLLINNDEHNRNFSKLNHAELKGTAEDR